MDAKNLVLWLVSNCERNRLKFANQLLMLASTGINYYGKCFKENKMECGDYGHNGAHQNKKCLGQLMRNHKFYLAFENSECRDYISEKVANAYANGMVPIVNGGLQGRADYERLFPVKSFIHIDDFGGDPNALYDYLIYLDKNKTAYAEYFDWQKHLTIVGNGYGPLVTMRLNQNELCKMCKVIHKNDKKDMRPRTFDLGKWAASKENCQYTYFE